MTESRFAAILEYEIRTRGGRGESFSAIVGSQANSSQIHYAPCEVPIGNGPLLIDWGAQVGWYCSDMTRTFSIGPMSSRIREIYEIVLEAQLAAIDACKPGVICADVDAVSRKIITDAGFGEYFGHGLGHGLGIDVHEAPYFNNLQTDIELRPGMVMTVEPGIYLPGIGGVRIEDDIVITDEGCRVLGEYPKDVDAMILEPLGCTGSIVNRLAEESLT